MRGSFAIKTALIGAALVGALIAGARGCNNSCNNRTIINPAYVTHSYASGISGHVEYTRYEDGSRDIKVYPGMSHRMFSSELYQDLDGDGSVDRIRVDGPEIKMHQLSGLYVRRFDYDAEQERFDEADSLLRELIAQYDSQ